MEYSTSLPGTAQGSKKAKNILLKDTSHLSKDKIQPQRDTTQLQIPKMSTKGGTGRTHKITTTKHQNSHREMQNKTWNLSHTKWLQRDTMSKKRCKRTHMDITRLQRIPDGLKHIWKTATSRLKKRKHNLQRLQMEEKGNWYNDQCVNQVSVAR